MEERPDKNPIGILLLNLGGPERLQDVEPFLFNLFSDRQIIRLGPAFLQKPIAWWIARKRAPKSRESYRLIGGGSPLGRITGEQGAALVEALASHGSFVAGAAMRYWQPRAGESLRRMADMGIRRIVALTLYPHYSVATTGSSLFDLHAAADKGFDIAEVREWPDEPAYVKALAATITEGIERFNGEMPQLVYSAHSLPVKFIREGDPYLDHLHRTIKAVKALTGIPGKLCFQSRSGPVEWLAPSTPDTLRELAGEGCRNVLMVPVSFVSDHVETLYEIDIQYRELAQSLGLRLERSESLNIRPGFIEALRNLVLAACRERGWL